jgi:hypothetical protein
VRIADEPLPEDPPPVFDITGPGARVKSFVVPTGEDLQMAIEARAALQPAGT